MRIRRPRNAKQHGFTLIELLIVIMMVMILAGIAAPKYAQSVTRAKEAALRQDLYHLRQSIDQYTLDKQRAPQSLEDLVSAGYFRELPVDPFTNSRDTWQPIMEDYYQAIDQNEPGITDVRSGASGTSTDGTTYSEW